jgi:uncharacterized protein (DUF305 family)
VSSSSDTTTAAPTDEDEQQPARVAWWLAVAAALAFLVGAVGYVIGSREADDRTALSPTDVGFLVDMTEHHDQAVEMALLQLANGSDPIALDFATEVLLLQRKELGIMETHLVLADEPMPERTPERITMAWMDMPTEARAMPGMATEAEMAALAEAGGAQSDRLFLELMRNHHAGGVHMAQWEVRYGTNDAVVALAERMARNQSIEVQEYTQLMQTLGFEV